MNYPILYMLKVLIPIILLFSVIILSYTIYQMNEQDSEYNDIANQVIRQAIRRYGSFSESNIPWITSFIVRHHTILPSYDNIINIPLITPDNITYNNKVLIRRLIHQMAHLYSYSHHHDDEFDKVEKQLLLCGQDLGYYESNVDTHIPVKCNYKQKNA